MLRFIVILFAIAASLAGCATSLPSDRITRVALIDPSSDTIRLHHVTALLHRRSDVVVVTDSLVGIGPLPAIHSRFRIRALSCAIVADTIFLGTQHGLFMVHAALSEPRLLPLPARDSLPPVTALAVDPAGDLWIGTSGVGLFQRHGGTVAGRSTARYVRALACHPDSSIWIGSDMGVLHLKHGELRQYSEEITSEGIEIKDNIIDMISCDADGTVWIGTGQGMNIVPASIAHHAAEAHHDVPAFDYVGRRGNDVHCVLAIGGATRRWLLGTTDGLFVLDGSAITEEHDHASDDLANRERTRARRIAFTRDAASLSVTCLLSDTSNSVFVGTSDGLYHVPGSVLDRMLNDQ